MEKRREGEEREGGREARCKEEKGRQEKTAIYMVVVVYSYL